MKILVSEYLCGGGWPDDDIPPSLLAEGKAMFKAIVEDVSRLPDTTVYTTWDSRFGVAPFASRHNLNIRCVSSAAEENAAFEEWLPELNTAFVIAPEFDSILQTRCEFFRESGVKLLNSDDPSLRMTSDKLETYIRCLQHGIPTIATRSGSEFETGALLPWKSTVAKLRDGAGSLTMSLISSPAEWTEFLKRTDTDRFVLQPLMNGRFLSVATIVAEGSLRHVLPVGEQLFSKQNRFAYVGGRIPARSVPVDAIRKLVERTIQAIPGLHGWIGFDVLLSEDSPDSPLLVEVNPRLTTSYIGYRALAQSNLAGCNLAEWIVDPASTKPLPFHGGSGHVQFRSTGEAEYQ